MRTLLAFGAGLVVGAVSSWLYLSEKYKELLVGEDDNEISEEDVSKSEEIIESYKIANNDKVEEKIEPKKEATPSSIIRKVAQKVDYNKAAEMATDAILSGVTTGREWPQDSGGFEAKPYKIGPTQFADEMQFYDKISLVYYVGDDVLTLHPDERIDENAGESIIIDDIDERIGKENLKHFGEYEPGMLYVRNESLGADYSIELKHGKYSNGIHMK